MNYKVLYRKYRPENFESIIGQDFITKTLKNSINNNRIAHAFIFTGPKGTGKTSTAKVFAKVVNCLKSENDKPCEECFNCLNANDNPDTIEIDAASNNGVDEIRELRNNVKISPNNSKYKIYIIDEVHMLSTEAFNALLKTLEEPPQHVIFILATTDIQKVPLTILSRCQRFDFKKISNEDISKRLQEIAKLEKIKIEEQAINEIAYITDGSFRDALSLLDQLNTGEKINIEAVSKASGSVTNQHLVKLYESFINNDVKIITEIFDEIFILGVNYKFFVEKFIQLLKNYAIKLKLGNGENIDLYKKIKKIIFELVNSLSIGRNTNNPFLLAELILLDQITIEKPVEIVEKEKKIISREIISEEKDPAKTEKPKILDESTDEDKTDVTKIEIDSNKDKELKEQLLKFKQVRINNCFVKPSKEDLNYLKNKWAEFLDNIKLTNHEICSLLLDSKVVASSDKYAIIEVISESQSNLLNLNTSSIEKQFIINDKKYKLVFITNEEWEKERKEYIKNLKNKHVYKTKKDFLLKNANKISKIESIALEMFDNNKIVIK